MLRRTCRVASGLGRSPLTFAELHGFELLGSRSVPELNLCAYHLRHLGTGAPYYHIDVDDANHTFCMGFRTPSENSKGTAHVLEHTTLCGSKKYPIRDPFFMMLKRSLSNFMNAMTGADYTIYPFSTTNPQDYHNLLDIYLDAVLHPLLREEDFNQEGHRVEVKVENGERRLVSNGVVFQEMRGVVPDPGRHFSRKLMQTMLPTTHYIHESGGYPPEVLKLSYDELVAFHRRHYHPSNSLTITYGSRHPASTMEKLNEYFSSFAATEPVVVPTMCDADRPTAPTTHHFEGPVDVMGDPDRQKRIALSFGISERSNELKDVVELSVLDGLLSSGPISPLYQSLIGSHIGTEYVPMKGYASYLSSPIITYGVAGVDEMRPDAEAEVRTAVESALRHVMKKGFDPRHVESIIFQEELQQRHRAADNGLHFCTSLCSRGLCRAGANPMDFLDWLPHLRQIAANNAACLLPRIEADLLHNPHQALLSVSAKPNFLDKLRRELQDVDDALTRDASEADKDRLEATTAEWLQRVRAPQNVDLLPTLTPADIPRTAFVEPTPRRCAAGEDLYTLAYPTNGLVYVHGLIPFESPATGLALRGLTLPQVPLLTTLLARTGAGPHNYKDLSVQTELACGGFSFAPVLNEDYSRPGTTIAGMAYAFYTTTAKLREALDLLALVLLEPRCSTEDAEVCSRVLARVKQYGADSIQSVQHRGHQVAITRAVSKVSARGALREQWSGLAQTMRASAMMERLQGSEEAATEEVRAILREYAELSVQLAGGLRAGKSWATCEPADVAAVEAELLRFHNRFPALRQEPSPYHMDIATSALSPAPTAAVLRERLPLDTSFVGMAVRLPELTWQSPDQAALRVACQVLSNEFLHRRIREEGGAYGAGCAATLQGEVGGWTMYSYRDPTPDATIAVFGEAAAWVGEQQQQRLVDEAKLRLFSTIDAPYAADSFGESYFLHGVDGALKQRLRDELLAVTPADLKKVAHYLTNSAATACVLEPAAEEKTS